MYLVADGFASRPQRVSARSSDKEDAARREDREAVRFLRFDRRIRREIIFSEPPLGEGRGSSEGVAGGRGAARVRAALARASPASVGIATCWRPYRALSAPRLELGQPCAEGCSPPRETLRGQLRGARATIHTTARPPDTRRNVYASSSSSSSRPPSTCDRTSPSSRLLATVRSSDADAEDAAGRPVHEERVPRERYSFSGYRT